MDLLNIMLNNYNAMPSSGGGNSNLFLVILIILPIGLIIFLVMKKKKGNGANNQKVKEEKDEVWSTIKKFLKEENEKGKEIIDAFTLKRPNPFDKSSMTKAQKIEAKIKEKEIKKLKEQNIEEYKKQKLKISIERKRKPRELYVVLFTTRNAKTLEIDPPRIIECEIILKKIEKNKTERTIKVNGLMNYDEEMKWIKPIKDKEDAIHQKQLEKRERRKKNTKKQD